MSITGLTAKTSYYFRVTASVTVTGSDGSSETQSVTSQASNLITTAPTNNSSGGVNHSSPSSPYSVPTDIYKISGAGNTTAYQGQQFGLVGDSISTLNSLTKENVETALGLQMKASSSWFTQSEGLCKKIYTNSLLTGVADKASSRSGSTAPETPLDSIITGLQVLVEDMVRLLTCQPSGSFQTVDQITGRVNTVFGPPGNSDLVKDLQLLADNLGQGTQDFLVDVWRGVEILFDWLCTAITCGANQTFQQVGPSASQFNIPLTPGTSKPYTNRRLFDFVRGTQKTIDSITANPLTVGLNSWAGGVGAANLQPSGVGQNIVLNFWNGLMASVQAACHILTSGPLGSNWQVTTNFQPEAVTDTVSRFNSVVQMLCASPLSGGMAALAPDPVSPGAGGAAFYNGVAGTLSFFDDLAKLFGISAPPNHTGEYIPTAGEVQTWINDTLAFLTGSSDGTAQGLLDIFQNFVECMWQIFVATPYSATTPAVPNPNGRQVYRKTNNLNGSTRYWSWNGSAWLDLSLAELQITGARLQQDLASQLLTPLLNFLNPGGNPSQNNFGDAVNEIVTFFDCIANTIFGTPQPGGQAKTFKDITTALQEIGGGLNGLIMGAQSVAWNTFVALFQGVVNSSWDIINILYSLGTKLTLPTPRSGDKSIQDLIDIFNDWILTVPVIGPLVQMITGQRIDTADETTIAEDGFIAWGLEQIANFFLGAQNGRPLMDAVKEEVDAILRPTKPVLDADGNVSLVPIPTGEWLQQIITRENIEYALKDLQATFFANVPVSHLNSAEKTNLLTRGGFVTKSTILNDKGWSCDTGTNLSDYAGGSARHDIVTGRSQKLYCNQTITVQAGDRISMAAQTKTSANFNGDTGSLRMGIVPFTVSGTGYAQQADVTLAIRGGTGNLVQTISSESTALGGQPGVTPYWTVPAGVVAVKAFIMVGSSATAGTAWWDSVSLWKAGGLEQENVTKLTGPGGAWSNFWDGLFGTTGSNKTSDDIKPAASSVAQAAGTANANGQTAMVVGQTVVNSIDQTFGSGTGTNASAANTLSQFKLFMQRLYGQDTPKTELIDTSIPTLQQTKVNNLPTDLNNRVDFTTYGSYLEGGDNLCSNPGFEDPSGYLGNGTYSTTVSFSGSRSARIVGNGSSQRIELVSDKTKAIFLKTSAATSYYVEFMVLGDASNTATGTGNDIGVTMAVYTSYGGIAAATNGLFASVNTVGKGSWVKVRGYITLPASPSTGTTQIAKVRPQILVTNTAAATGNTYYFDEVLVQEVTESANVKKKLYNSNEPQDQILQASVPGLQASQIVEGVFAAAQVPNLPQGKIDNLSTDLGNRVDYTTYGSYLAGGNNICSNPGFEDSTGYLSHGTYVTSSTVAPFSGTQCAQLAATTGSSRVIELISNKTQAIYASASGSEAFYVEFAVRGGASNTATGTANTIGLVMPIYTAAGGAASGGTVGLYTSADAVGKNAWVIVRGYIVLLAGVTGTGAIAKVRPQLQISGAAAAAGNVYFFDEVVVREVTDSVDIKSKLYNNTVPQTQILSGSVPGLQASKITEGIFDITRLPVDDIGSEINPTSGSGCVLQRRTSAAYNLPGAQATLPDGFYTHIAQTSTDIANSAVTGGRVNRMTVTISGWYLAEMGFKIRTAQGFLWSIAPVLYKNGARFRIGNDANIVASGFGTSTRYIQSSWIIYLNANEYVQAGWDASGLSEDIIDIDSTGLSNYFSLSLLNRSYA